MNPCLCFILGFLTCGALVVCLVVYASCCAAGIPTPVQPPIGEALDEFVSQQEQELHRAVIRGRLTTENIQRSYDVAAKEQS